MAYLKVDAELLRDLLHLPSDCVIVSSVEAESGMVRLLIDHGSIDADTVEVTALFRTQRAVEFAGFETVRKRTVAAVAEGR